VKKELEELYRYRDLLYMIVFRDIKIRYKQSVMGFLWAVLMPSLIAVAGVIVRLAFAVVSGKHLETSDIASVAVKSLPWAFLVSSIRFSCNSLLGNFALVTKIYFPKEIFPLAAVAASLFDSVVASGVLILILVVLRIGWSVTFLWAPLLLLILLMMAIGVALIVSSASLFFRDVKYLVEVVLTFGIFFTPVFYDVHMFGHAGNWLLLNPAAPILEGLGACIVRQQQPDLAWIGYSFAFSVTVFFGGYVFFKHLEPAFAESI
jgi:lipopolysaccharide transport system permease protein